MKKYVLLCLMALAIVACENVEDNSPALQAELDNVFFKSIGSAAQMNDDNSVIIQASTQDQTLTLFVSRNSLNTFELGSDNPNYALFDDGMGNVYTTVPQGSGSITISELSPETGVSGTFKFNAVLSGVDTLVAQKGVFFQVPFVSENIDVPGIGEPDPTVLDGTLVAEVDGDLFDPNIVESVVVSNQIRIKGTLNDEYIQLFIPLDIEAGSYSLPSTGLRADYKIMDVSESAISGSLRVFEHNIIEKVIKGTFVFTTENHVVSLGQFNISY